MNILLIGGSSSLINNLILKLRKEGHRIFVLTGDRYKQHKYKKVFERYDFPYDSEQLGEVFASINPDVTLFMGAFDTNYRWENEKSEMVRFTSNFINLLVAYSTNKKGKFILLSSNEVYEGDFPNDITEEEQTNGDKFQSAAFAQAEQTCLSFQKTWDLDMTILRLNNVYNIPKTLGDVNNICANMCLHSLRNGSIPVDLNHKFSLLFENDAVEFIYQAMRKEEHSHTIYHLSSNRVVSEVELAGIIQKNMKESSNVVTVDGTGGRCVLSGKRFEEEYGVRAFANLEDTVKKMVDYMQKHKDVFLNDREEELPWWKRFINKWAWLFKVIFPFVENLIVFIPFFMLNNRVTGSEYFAKLDPYLLYVLLFAIIHGQQQATFSAMLATAGYLFRQMYNRSAMDVVLDYNTYVWIAQLFILGLVVGYMRNQIRVLREEGKELETHLSRQIVDIRSISRSNIRVKEIMEQQVTDNRDSIGKIYSITSKLDRQMPDEVMFDATEMLMELMHTKDVALYNIVNGDYARMFSASSKRARTLGNSIRYREMEEMYEELCVRKVYINKSMDERYPLMANAIFEGDEMKTIIMVWGLGWEQMTLGHANYLTVTSYLIQNAVLRAREYMDALEEKRYIAHTKIMENDAFESLIRSYLHAKDRNLVECTLLEVEDSENDYRQIGQVMGRKLRNSDYLGYMSNGKVYALLANTDEANAVFVQNRFKENGYDTMVVEKVAV